MASLRHTNGQVPARTYPSTAILRRIWIPYSMFDLCSEPADQAIEELLKSFRMTWSKAFAVCPHTRVVKATHLATASCNILTCQTVTSYWRNWKWQGMQPSGEDLRSATCHHSCKEIDKVKALVERSWLCKKSLWVPFFSEQIYIYIICILCIYIYIHMCVHTITYTYN